MSTPAAETSPPQDRERAPDVRGPTGPLPLAIFIAGIAALALVLGGTAVVQIAHAVNGSPLTPECRAQGLTPFNPNSISNPGIRGASSICHILEAAVSPGERAFLIAAIALGALAMVAGFGIYRRMDTRRKRNHAFAGAVLGLQALILGSFFLYFFGGEEFQFFARNFLAFGVLQGQLGAFLNGAKITIFLAFAGEIGGIIIGLILAMLGLSQYRVVRAPARAYVNFFRGTPLIWQLSFFYLGVAIGLRLTFLGTLECAILVFSLNTGAYAAEVFRAGIQSIERGQMEAARGLGFSHLQAMRFAIVPQAVRRVIPPLMNEFVILIKDTSLIVVLGLITYQRDIFSVSQDGYSASANATFFVAAAIGYLVVTLPLIRLVNWAESRLRSGMVGVGGGFGQ
jgi:His/Glu/Gln/Arg/opine family amino acid ABC transporter permease subunit